MTLCSIASSCGGGGSCQLLVQRMQTMYSSYICTNFPQQAPKPSPHHTELHPLPSWDNEHIEANLLPQPVNRRQSALSCTSVAHAEREREQMCLCNHVHTRLRRLRHAFGVVSHLLWCRAARRCKTVLLSPPGAGHTTGASFSPTGPPGAPTGCS